MNSAVTFAGALSLFNTPLISITNSSFTLNNAKYGSAIAVASCKSVNLYNNVFKQNKASASAAVYWVHSLSMSEPLHLRTHNSFSENLAVYGQDYSTNPIKIKALPPTLYQSDYLYPLSHVIDIYLQDYYHHRVITDNRSDTNFYLPLDAFRSCQYNLRDVGVLGNLNSRTRNGHARFENFGASCIPGGRLNASFSMQPYVHIYPQYYNPALEMSGPGHLNSSKTDFLTVEVPFTFRRCKPGEIYNFASPRKDECLYCLESYSVYDNEDNSITSCQPCPEGSLTCFGDNIILPPGFWRWNKYATTIFQCPFGINSCIGGNYSGQPSCNTGYHGPLCGICNDLYYTSPDGNFCLPCATDSKEMPMSTLIMIAGLCLSPLIPIFYFIRKWAKAKQLSMWDYVNSFLSSNEDPNREMTAKQRKSKKNRLKWTSRFKITLATYQIIMSCPSTLGLSKSTLFNQTILFLFFI